jgi:hypothetical protein
MKKFLSGFLVGALLFSTSLTFAENKTIDAFFNNIKIMINGQEVHADTEPFVYNARTYVPVRFIAEAFDKEVKFNESTNTVEITDKVVTDTVDNIDTVDESEESVTESAYKEPEPQPIPKTIIKPYTNDPRIVEYEGVQYIYFRDTLPQIEVYKGGAKSPDITFDQYRYEPSFDKSTKKTKLILQYVNKETGERTTLIDDVPHKAITGPGVVMSGSAHIPYDYYINTIKPLIEN